MADLDILPTWAANYLQDNILEHAHVLNALPIEEGPHRGSFLLNTSRGAMMLVKRRMGEPRHWLLPLPGERFDFVCDACGERIGLVDPDVPRVVHCPHCATEYTLVDDAGTLRLLTETNGSAVTPVPAAAPAEAARVEVEESSADDSDGDAGSEDYRDFRGDVHPVIDVEGIGVEYARRLEQIGIKTTARLCYEDPADLARRIDASPKVVTGWQAMAQLMKIDGVGPQYAEALVRAGVDGVDALKRRSPARIAADVNRYLDGLDANVLGQKVTQKRVEAWQAAAKKLRRVRQPVPAQ